MNITIKDTNAAQNILEQNAVRWKLYKKKAVKSITFTYTFGLFLFIIGMAQFSDYGWKTFNGEYTYYTNWHFSESLGFIIIILATISLIAYFRTKKQFFKTVNLIADRHLKTTNEILIHITDDNLVYQSYELTLDMKWWLFSSYTLKDNYLFLNVDGNPKSFITVDKRLISPDNFTELLEFIKKRLVPKPCIV